MAKQIRSTDGADFAGRYAAALLGPSRNARYLIKGFEPLRKRAERVAESEWLIGWGHRSYVLLTDMCTAAIADSWLDQDLNDLTIELRRLGPLPLYQGQFDALASFVHNWGIRWWQTSNARSRLMQADYDGCIEAMIDAGSPGRTGTGETCIRRFAEGQLWITHRSLGRTMEAIHRTAR